MKTSVVIPIHSEAYLERKANLLNLIKKASPYFKIILVTDNFSSQFLSDLRLAIHGISQEDITILSGEFGNPGDARNAGIEVVNSDWITFWDSDDDVKPELFAILIEVADQKNVEIAKGAYLISKDNGNFTRKSYVENYTPNEYFKHLLNPGLWRYAFKRNIYTKVRFPSIRLGEDQDYLVQALINRPKLYASNELVYVYNINGHGQISGDIESFKDLTRSLNYLQNLPKNRDLEKCDMLIIYTSYFKQLVTGVSRAGWKQSNLDLIKVSQAILTGIRYGIIHKILAALISQKLRFK